MSERYFCPRCRERTLVRKKSSDVMFGEYEMLICEKCGFAVGVEALVGECIPEELLSLLPITERRKVEEALARGDLVRIQRFDIKAGRWVTCIDYDWKRAEKDWAVREVYNTLYTFYKALMRNGRR